MTSEELIETHLQDVTSRPERHACLQFALLQAPRDGFIAEFGVHSGGTINFLAGLTDETVHGFDSFCGLPCDWRDEFRKGHFAVRDVRELRFAFNVRIFKGWFRDSLPRFLNEVPGPARFIHIDADLYASAAEVLFGLQERIVPGTVIQFDEFYGYEGWEQHEYRALTEFARATGKGFQYLCWTGHEQVAVRIL